MSALQSFGNPSADSKSVPEAVAIFIEDTDRIVKAMPTDQDDDYAEVVETYSLYTAEDYQNPLWFLIKTVGYIILSPFVLIFHLLPKFLNWFAQKLCSALCNLCRLLCNGLLWCMSFFNKYMLTPFNTYVLTPICSGISWLCEITYNGIAWLCEKTYNGVVYAGSALHKYLLAPCYKYLLEPVLNGIAWVCEKIGYVLGKICDCVSWVCGKICGCVGYCCGKVCDCVLCCCSKFCYGFKWIGARLRDYIFMPLYNAGVCFFGSIWDYAVLPTFRALRDYVFSPVWNAVAAVGAAAWMYVIVPVGSGVVAMTNAVYEGIIAPVGRLIGGLLSAIGAVLGRMLSAIGAVLGRIGKVFE